MKKLTLSHTPIPFSDEFLASFLLRASYSNGYQSPKQMLNSVGIPVYKLSYDSIFTDENKFKQIIERLDLSYDLLELVIKKVPPTSQYFFWNDNQIIQPKLLTIGLNKFCPICLDKNGYWKKKWLLTPLLICPDHQVNLISNCPECLNPLQTNRRSLFECSNCDFDIRKSQIEPSAPENMNTNSWFIEKLNSAEENFVGIFFDIWIALIEYFSNLEITANYSYILKLCYEYFYNEERFTSIFIKEIENNLDYAHPQIQILPFSRNKSRFRNIVNKFKSHFSNYNNKSSQPSKINFNKNDVIHILGITFVSFNKRLKAGILYHEQFINSDKTNFTIEILEDWLIYEKENINGTYKYNRPPTLEDESNHYYTINEIMKILDINIGNTRLFLKIPTIPATKKYINRSMQLCLEREFVDKFNKNYIFLSSLARTLDVSVFTLRDKLSSLNINPIDSDKTYPAYYNRSSVSYLTKDIIEKITTYKNNRRRNKKNTTFKYKNNNFISLNEAAELLSISSLQVAQLIHHKWIQVEDLESRPYRIPISSVNKLLQQKNDPSFIELDEVLRTLNCTFSQLQKSWIMTGFLTIRTIGYWRSFSKKQFNQVVEIKKEFFTASEATSYLDMHRTHITNLVTRGLIKPYFYGNHHYSIRLFKIKDVENLLNTGYGNQRSEKNLNLCVKDS
ncbi:TniQ family protein [Acinetobacter guillouiae]|uniref:TniQ family protein n=1 Tax=Acinetobacter guillouiae TaxID=106649 RepID=UPI0026E3F340|nr:TniQ family protein [Acinetobacter guillouiae]MDO6646512.1 TniQ family protein [Acinetobacter guillouiae]